jgi:hypothetical protein
MSHQKIARVACLAKNAAIPRHRIAAARGIDAIFNGAAIGATRQAT